MEPMSMPSSSDAVATTQRRLPDFNSFSTASLCSLETDPWWALAMTASPPKRFAYSSFRCAVSLSHAPRELTNTAVVRC